MAELEVSFLSTWRSRCGVASYTANLKDALDSMGVQTDVEPIERDKLIYLSRAELREHFRQLARRMRHADIAHVQHEFGLYSGAYGYSVSTSMLRAVLLELALLGKPTVITLHTDPFAMFRRKKDPAVFGYNAYLKALWRARIAPLFRATGLEAIVHTRVSRRAAIESGIPAGRIHVIRHGVPSRRPASEAERRELRTRLGYAPDTKVLAIFGFLDEYKGHATLIECLTRLPENYHLLIVGGVHPFSATPAGETILAELERHPSLKERVTVRGFVPAGELADCQEAADICVAPYRKGTPLSASGSITWALASGKPVVASGLPAFMELRDYMDCLELVTPDAPRELALTIEQLLNDPERMRQLVFQAHSYCTRHSWEATADAHVQLYEQLQRRRRLVNGLMARFRPERVTRALADRSSAVIRTRIRTEQDGLAYLPLHVAGSQVTFALDPNSDDQLVRLLIRHGYPNEPGALLMQRLLRPGSVVVDLGAHVGVYALAAAARGCRVVAVEANPANVRSLRASVARNQFTNMTVIHAAASDRDGRVDFVPNGIWGYVASNGPEPSDRADCVEVPAAPVGRLLEDLGIDHVDFVKMDVEGSEPQAIEGMLPLLARDDAPLILFESNASTLRDVSGTTYQDLHRRLEELGFQLYVVDLERVGRLVPVSAGDFMPHAVLEYLAAKRLPEDIFPWTLADRFTQEELAKRVVRASELDTVGYRAHAASVIATGPEWLKSDPRIGQARRRLMDDESPDVRDALRVAS